MAAYAAVVSLMHIIDQIQNHPRPPISLAKTQVESLAESVTFLQEFLEGYSHVDYTKEADDLESRIADAAYAAEDVIESHIVDRILASHGKKVNSILASHDAEEISSNIDSPILPQSTTRDENISSDNDSQILPRSKTRDKKIKFFKCFRGPRKAATDHEDEFCPTDNFHQNLQKEDQIHAGFTGLGDEFYLSDHEKNGGFYQSLRKDMDSLEKEVRICAGSIDSYEALQEVVGAMDSIKKEAMEIKEKTRVQDQQHRNPTMPPGSLRSSSNGQNTMVGIDDALHEIMDKLTGGQPNRQIIPIVGMGGMGKTTLARIIYAKPLIKEHFDICAWATISQEYDPREILREILCQENKEAKRDVNEDVLGEMLYKHFWGRRYLIVMDDMWNIEAWDEVRRFIPDNKNGSRIVITTRLSDLAFQLTDSYRFEMQFLDKDTSWKLFCKTVFGEKGCPLELEEIGKKIAENCRGLPMSVVVIGGLLAKSNHIPKYWEYIAKNLNSLVNSQDDERCLKILYMSYKQLPVYLKPCFLYMGVFPEDHMIQANMLIKLWVAEGFLKQISGKSLEDVAEEYLEELVNRNLVHARTHVGKIKHCSIHDLLRDLCLREAKKERFYNVRREHSVNSTKDTNTQRRVVIRGTTLEKEVVDKLQSMSLARSLICQNEIVPLSLNFMLLRIVNVLDAAAYSYPLCLLENMFRLINTRYFSICVDSGSKFPYAVNLLWNLHTLIVHSSWLLTAPSEIWNMPQLRHVKFPGGLYLPDPPRRNIDMQDNVVLGNLQSLSKIVDFKCGEEVIKRIPNIKKLGILYKTVEGDSHYCLNNLNSLHKLESFRYISGEYPYPSFARLEGQSGTDYLQNLSFPHSLKKLNLEASHVLWDDIMEKIGSLPLLEVLKLQAYYFEGCVWETVEGQFCSLKFLRIAGWNDLEYWKTESTHFPCLEQLVLVRLDELKEIPSNIGEIPTLQSIELQGCSDSVIISAKKIEEEQEELGEVTLQVRVFSWWTKDAARLKSLASPNFQVQYKR